MGPARRITFVALGIPLSALALSACAGGGGLFDGGGDAGGAATGEAESRAALDNAQRSKSFALGASQQSSAPALPALRATIVKTARVDIEVRRGELQDAVQEATTTAGDVGGFVLTTSLDEDRFRTGSVVLRVPAPNFEDALAEIEDLGDVQDKSVTGQDVGQEFIDLEARLRNWRSQETVLLRLMDRATTIGQTIRVQDQLQGVQLEIERIRGRLRFLEDQTALSTITASFVASGVPPEAEPNVIERALQRAVELTLGVIAALIVSLGVIIPAAILFLLALFLYKQVRPRFTS